MAEEAVLNHTTSVGISGSFHHVHATPYFLVFKRGFERSEEAGYVELEREKEKATRSERNPCAAHSVEAGPDNDPENTPIRGPSPSPSKAAYNIPVPRSPLTPLLLTNTPYNGFTSPTTSPVSPPRILWEAKGKGKAVDDVQKPPFVVNLKKAKKVKDDRLTYVAPPPFPPYSAVRDVLEDPIEYIEIDSDDGEGDDETDATTSDVNDEVKVQTAPRPYQIGSDTESDDDFDFGLEVPEMQRSVSLRRCPIRSVAPERGGQCGGQAGVGVCEDEPLRAPTRLVIKLPARAQNVKKRSRVDDAVASSCLSKQGRYTFKVDLVESAEGGDEQPAKKRRQVVKNSKGEVAGEGGEGFLKAGKGSAKRCTTGTVVSRSTKVQTLGLREEELRSAHEDVF
ncbi:hypothetical protein L218DRAFT_998684 [Marasmius fiardii PR-910]|nr:hypothetical protein L218DRAFT_998684 [Marasmius fiardii PR-910]